MKSLARKCKELVKMIYLKGRIQRSSFCWFTLQINGCNCWSQASLKLGTRNFFGSCTWLQRSKDLGDPDCFPGYTNRELDQKWSNQVLNWYPYGMLATQVVALPVMPGSWSQKTFLIWSDLKKFKELQVYFWHEKLWNPHEDSSESLWKHVLWKNLSGFQILK